MLRTALMELTAEYGYEAVTVSAITARALVHRTTFYRYYEDKDDLLLRGMAELYDELVADAPDAPAIGDGASTRLPSALTVALSFVARNERFFRRMFGEDGDPRFQAKIRDYHRSIIGDRIRLALRASGRSDAASDEARVGLLIGSAAGAFDGVVSAWLAERCEASVDAVAEQCLSAIGAAIEAFR